MPEPSTRPRLPSIPSERDVSRHLQMEENSKKSMDEFVAERILLTPPPQFANDNPLDTVVFPFSPPTASIIESRQRDNDNAYFRNARHRTDSSGQDAMFMFNGLHIQTDMPPPRRSASTHSVDSQGRMRSSTSAASLPRRVPSIRSYLHSTAGSISPGSVMSSPQIAAMLDITPLPSPTMGAFETWQTVIRSRSRASSTSSRTDLGPALFPPPMFTPLSPRKKSYQTLKTHASKSSISDEAFTLSDDARARTRSISEYVPDSLSPPKPRHVAVSGSGAPQEASIEKSALQREEYMGVQRGITSKFTQTPPSLPLTGIESTHEDEPAPKRPKLEVFTANNISTGQVRKYESLKQLGQGTFSKVYLAVRQVHDRQDTVDYTKDSVNMAGVRIRSRRLVAVKVVEPGPAGGANAERVQVSLKREVDLLKSIKHPSLVHLKAFGNDASNRALLVINYCPGGDLFEVASTKLHVLTPSLVRRIFSELVSAVRYLHQKYIVHRDIKLENILLNIPIQVHSDVPNWQTLDRAVVTLTDLGLSRRIPEPPESPLLTTRCGSEDYAAPEILMGQPYDGRQTDAWALGVLLYALMEGRLPFDPLPGARGDPATLRARTPHRIARCEWAWVRYGDEDGEWDPIKGEEMAGANICVQGLLKRNTRRKALSEVREMRWVSEGVWVDGGLRWVEEEQL